MREIKFKLKNDDGKTVGYLLLKLGTIFWKTRYECDEWTCNPEFAFDWASIHPFVTKDKNHKDVFEGDKVRRVDGEPCIVEWFAEECRYILHNKQNCYDIDIDPLECEQFELIEEPEQ